MISSVAGALAGLFLGAVVLSADAPDDQGVQVECEGTLPFSRVQLEEALRPRWHLVARPAPQPVRVREQGNDTVSIQVGAGRREVVLGGQTGESAARIVALLAVDLATQPELAQGASAAGGTSFWRATALTTQLLVPFIANGWTPTLEPTVGFERRVLGPLTVGVSVGVASLSAGDAPATLRLFEVPVRVGVGYGGSWFAVRAAGVGRTHFVSGAGDQDGVRLGASLSASVYRQLSPRIALVASAGVDGLRSRIDFRVDGEPVLATRWIVPWLGVGVALRSTP